MGVELNAGENLGRMICDFQQAVGTVGRVLDVLSRSGSLDSYTACLRGGLWLLVLKEYRRNY